MSTQDMGPTDTTRKPLPTAAPGTDQNGNSTDGRVQEAGAEDITYEPVPPQKTVRVSVRYRVRGRGRPLPFPAEEGEGA